MNNKNVYNQKIILMMQIATICLFFSCLSFLPLNELFSVIEKWHSPNDVRENAKTSSKCKNHSVF